jgi:hypothetical protein
MRRVLGMQSSIGWLRYGRTESRAATGLVAERERQNGSVVRGAGRFQEGYASVRQCRECLLQMTTQAIEQEHCKPVRRCFSRGPLR